jgi:hypothetical protein
MAPRWKGGVSFTPRPLRVPLALKAGWVDTKGVLDVVEKRNTLRLPVIEPILPHFGSIPNRPY